jgi:hypothetical protein
MGRRVISESLDGSVDAIRPAGRRRSAPWGALGLTTQPPSRLREPRGSRVWLCRYVLPSSLAVGGTIEPGAASSATAVVRPESPNGRGAGVIIVAGGRRPVRVPGPQRRNRAVIRSQPRLGHASRAGRESRKKAATRGTYAPSTLLLRPRAVASSIASAEREAAKRPHTPTTSRDSRLVFKTSTAV